MDPRIIQNINFREKQRGWKHYRATIHSFKYGAEHGDVFINGFLKNLYLRPACYECNIRSLKSGSDITLGDFWGIQNIHPDFDDDRGVSLVMINSDTGNQVFQQLRKTIIETDYVSALTGNPSIEESPHIPAKRKIFFQQWHKGNIIPLIKRLTKITVLMRSKRLLAIILRKAGLLLLFKSLSGRQK
jgi:hypothetical protein